MIEVKNRENQCKYFEGYDSLNIKGVLTNTNYPTFVDDLEKPEGIWVKDKYFNFLYSEQLNFIELFDQTIKEDYFGFAGTNKSVLEYYFENELIQWKNTCDQYHYSGEKFSEVMALESLNLSDATYVNDNYEYKNSNSLTKIKDAIKSRPTSCLRIDGKIVSFVLLHDDDSIGYMYTLPEYRGNGYAYELAKDIINKTLNTGRLPYIQIVQGNEKSKQLALKLGFEKHGEVHWFGVVRLGESFKVHLKTYQAHFGVDAKSVSVKTTLELKHKPLEVEVTSDRFIYKDERYDYQMIYSDEIYYIHSHMPEKILISGLMQLMKEDYELVISNQDIKTDGFKSV
ncbi:MAG: GNAT family N-acetyltransferase [Clostridiales bacterium]|nr:GNAT family N-acetyltransferase [Clostridiales bacterium]